MVNAGTRMKRLNDAVLVGSRGLSDDGSPFNVASGCAWRHEACIASPQNGIIDVVAGEDHEQFQPRKGPCF